jgi:hypothetical protein
MAKKVILALIILILLVFGVFILFGGNTVDVYLDGENVTVNTHTFSNADTKSMNAKICDIASEAMNDTSSNAATLKEDIMDICNNYGLEDVEITVDSTLGENQIPVLVYVDGTSMLPTLQDGQTVLVNKTHNVHVGDIVVAESDEYGGIIKRVDEINGNSIHLSSDNKEVSYEYLNGDLYEVKGISTWVDISDINGVVIAY